MLKGLKGLKELLNKMQKKICAFFICLIHNIHIFKYEDVADKDDLMGYEDTAKRGRLFVVVLRGGGGQLFPFCFVLLKII